MDIDELKSTWNAQKIAPPEITRKTPRSVNSFGRKLTKRYRIATFGSLVCVVPLWFCCQYLELPQWLSLWLCLFLLIMGALKGIEWIFSSNIDFGYLSLTKAIGKVTQLKRMMNRNLIFGILCGIPLLSSLLIHYYKVFDTSVFMAGIVGAVAGAVIGVRGVMQNRAIINRMEAMLDDATQGADD